MNETLAASMLQNCETFTSSSCVSDSCFENVYLYIYIHLVIYGLLWFRTVALWRFPRCPDSTRQHNLFLLDIDCTYKHVSMCK